MLFDIIILLVIILIITLMFVWNFVELVILAVLFIGSMKYHDYTYAAFVILYGLTLLVVETIIQNSMFNRDVRPRAGMWFFFVIISAVYFVFKFNR